MPIRVKNNNMEGTRPNAADYGGHPAPTGPALPNLINAVRMFKIKVNTNLFISAKAKANAETALMLTLKLTLNILTAFIRLGRAGPDRGRVPSNPVWFKVG